MVRSLAVSGDFHFLRSIAADCGPTHPPTQEMPELFLAGGKAAGS